jgi:tetratricopeptide (TPR) repeat protein
MAVVGVFAESRRTNIAKALAANEPWPPEWLTDVHAAYSVLARHPHGNDQQVLAHYDFLRRMGATAKAAQVLDEGLARFPDSWVLHDRMRGRILAEKGVGELEAAYDSMLRSEIASPHTEWFAGYASIVAAEYYRRSNQDTDAVAAYERAIAHYENAIATTAESRESADHYVALAIAGRARVELERGDYERAHADVLASFERKTDAADDLDGLGFSPVGTAQMLLAKLKDTERVELATSLEAALDGLDPILLRLPEFERQGPRRGAGGRRRDPNR